MNKKKKEFLLLEEYLEASETLEIISTMILFSFAQQNCTLKNIILRNFIARAVTSMKSIFSLYSLKDYHSTWILYRTMVDRLFHLHDLNNKNNYLEFDNWSFHEKYKEQNKVKSDIEFKHEAIGHEYKLNKEQQLRIKKLELNKPSWNRPRAESIAKSMDLKFLYTHGYDYASTHIHPMSDDGLEDFYRITNLKPTQQFTSHISVLNNTILTCTLILEESMNHSSFYWRTLLYDYLTDIREFLSSGNKKYLDSSYKIMKLFPDFNLCK